MTAFERTLPSQWAHRNGRTRTISRARAAWSAMTDDPTHLAQLDRILEGMCKAGAPE
jgi:hypothetical protein